MVDKSDRKANLPVGSRTKSHGGHVAKSMIFRKSGVAHFTAKKAFPKAGEFGPELLAGFVMTGLDDVLGPVAVELGGTGIAALPVVDLAFVDLHVVDAEHVWAGDPRNMRDEDLEFFGLDK